MGNEKQELKLRVEAKKKALEAQIAQLKVDSVGGTNDAIDALQKQLNSVQSDLKSGWENMSESIAGKLNSWLSADKK